MMLEGTYNYTMPFPKIYYTKYYRIVIAEVYKLILQTSTGYSYI